MNIDTTKHSVVQAIENVLFNVKWALLLFYFGLIAVLAAYVWVYFFEIIQLFTKLPHTTEHMKIVVLDFCDVVMIGNLVKMILTGSYNSFISKDHGYPNEKISSGVLKLKILTSVIVVATISLLKEFVTEAYVWDVVYKQLTIYCVFLVAALVLGILEYLHIKGEKIEHEIHH